MAKKKDLIPDAALEAFANSLGAEGIIVIGSFKDGTMVNSHHVGMRNGLQMAEALTETRDALISSIKETVEEALSGLTLAPKKK